MSVKDCEICAINFLARREHSRFELKQKLNAKNFAFDEINAALDALQKKGLQSDERFAASYARMRVGRGYGHKRIRFELRERGIDDEMADNVLAEYSDKWQELAEKVRAKKFGSKKPEKYSKEHQKQLQFLYYRGFD